MDLPTSAKSRSLGNHSKSSTNPVKSKVRRPDLGERHKSAPLVSRTRTSQIQQDAEHTKSTDNDNNEHDSKSSSRKSSWSQRTNGRRNSQISELELHPLLKLVVLGNPEVGKTSFIRHALEMRKPATSPISSSKVSFGGVVYRVQITELELDEVKIEEGRHISWPKYVNGLPFSSPDAVICMYSIIDSDSITGVPQFLSALSNLDTPVQVVASKIDAPDDDHELDQTFTDKLRSKFPHVLIGETSTKSAEYAKKCMLMILKAILGSWGGNSAEAALSMFRNKTSTSSCAPTKSGGPDEAQLRSQTGSDMLPSIAEPHFVHSEDEDGSSSEEDRDDRSAMMERQKALMRLQTSDLDRNSGVPRGPHTPVSETESSAHQVIGNQSTAPQTPESYSMSMLRPGTADSRAHQTFFNLDDDSPTDASFNESFSPENSKPQETSRIEGGVRFSALVDKLLQLPISKNDSKFAPSFLCLYRAFATPTKLLVAIIDRFVRVEASEAQQLTKVAELLRYLSVMAQWTASYPGDFASSDVRELATTFVHGLEKSKSLGPAAKEICNNLQVFVHDEDFDWAFNDTVRGPNLHRQSSSSELRGTDDSDSDVERNSAKANRLSARSSGVTTVSSIAKSSLPSSQSASNLAVLENAKQQAEKLRTIPHINLNKLQWHLFMDTPTEELAREITRIDWTMYSAIRPRDFVRYVTKPKERKKTDNIGAMIRHFNHLALLVAGVVLLRDKPKHRAKALEKFMDLAWKVRQLNNYNSLAALVAGITSHEVVRLGQTHELVPAETKKQFLRLTILMASAKSYATYRMAWENSFAERIPFISALLRDLTLAAGANSTFVGGGINWKKFEIMGESIVHIQKSYEHPYSFPEKTQKTQEIMRLVLETRIVEEAEDSADPHDELYNRSVQVEPQAGTNDNRKKFDWLRR